MSLWQFWHRSRQQSIPFEPLLPPSVQSFLCTNVKAASRAFSKTPTFCLFEDQVLVEIAKLKAAITRASVRSSIIAYSFKTNYTVPQHIDLQKKGVWAEVVSDHEYTFAKKHGYQKFVVNGPWKSDALLATAKKLDHVLHLHHQTELLRFCQLFSKQKVSIGLRVNPELPGMNSRFGFSLHEGAFLSAAKTLAIHGCTLTSVQFHLGPDIVNARAYAQALEKTAAVIFAHPELFAHLKYIDIGGGFPTSGLRPYGFQKWSPPLLDAFFSEFAPVWQRLLLRYPRLTLIVEPGKLLVEQSTLLATQVVDVRQTAETQAITINASTNMLPLVWYQPQQPMVWPKENRNAQVVPSTLFGSTCQESDVLYSGQFPRLESTDNQFILFSNVGAYNQNMAADFIFPKPPTFFIPSQKTKKRN